MRRRFDTQFQIYLIKKKHTERTHKKKKIFDKDRFCAPICSNSNLNTVWSCNGKNRIWHLLANKLHTIWYTILNNRIHAQHRVFFFLNIEYRIISKTYNGQKMGYNGAYVFVLFSQDELYNTQKSIRYFPDRRADGSIKSLVFWAESIGEPDSKHQDIDYRRTILFDSARYECDHKIGVAYGDTGNIHCSNAIYWYTLLQDCTVQS